MGLMGCGSSMFGPKNQFIKISGGDFVAIQGSEIIEKLITSDLKIPYKQILKGRIILKPGQVNYLLNHLGLGDNVTFLALKVTYDPKSTNETENYIIWNYHNNFTASYIINQFLVLTGNSVNRIPQIYLTNPNTKYPVQIDVMLAVIDDEYSFFTDSMNQGAKSFIGLEYTDIYTHIPNESIVIKDKNIPPKPLIYLNLSNIENLERVGNILVINDDFYGVIFLQFLNVYHAAQAHSLINYVVQNNNININNLEPLHDSEPPVIYFNSMFNDSYIAFNGQTSGVPYNTSLGITFSFTASLADYSTNIITKPDILSGLISHVVDNRDGTMSVTYSNIIISSGSNTYEQITTPGNYTIKFNISDLALNNLNHVFVDVYIY